MPRAFSFRDSQTHRSHPQERELHKVSTVEEEIDSVCESPSCNMLETSLTHVLIHNTYRIISKNMEQDKDKDSL